MLLQFDTSPYGPNWLFSVRERAHTPFFIKSDGGRCVSEGKPGHEIDRIDRIASMHRSEREWKKMSNGQKQTWLLMEKGAWQPPGSLTNVTRGAQSFDLMKEIFNRFPTRTNQDTARPLINTTAPWWQHAEKYRLWKMLWVWGWVEESNIKRTSGSGVLDWPSQTPNLNPTEDLWRELKMAVYWDMRETKRKMCQAGRIIPYKTSGWLCCQRCCK